MNLELVEIDPNDLANDFENMVLSLDEPISDPTSFSYFKLMKRVKEKGFKVLLMGHGGDELLWGYDDINKIQEIHLIKSLFSIKSFEYIKSFLKIPKNLKQLYANFFDLYGLKSSIYNLYLYFRYKNKFLFFEFDNNYKKIIQYKKHFH